MATKAQHAPAYETLPPLLRALREEAGLSQRALGELLGKPQSWVHNCEVANRRVDVAEFAAWATACGVDPQVAFTRFLDSTRSRRHRRSPSG
jgi:transcriptional regulator with XRE-family HTH domain